MASQHEQRSRRFLSLWVEWACRMAWAVILVCALITGAAGYFIAHNLKIDASIDNMLAKTLPFRQTEAAIGKAFPLSNDVLSVVVEGEDDEAADRAATALANRLATMTGRFRSVFYPEGLSFFRHNGLLYLDLSKLETLSDDMAKAQPLLASLSADPTLRGLADILALAIEQSNAAAAVAIAPALNRMAGTVRKLEEGKDAQLSWQSLLANEPTDGSALARKFILVQPVLDNTSLEPVEPALNAIADAARDLKLDTEHGVAVRFTGNALMLQEELDTVRDGMGIVGAISLTLVVVLLVIGLRSLRLVAATLTTLIVGLLWTAAFAVLAFEALNIISVAFAVLFIGLSVDFGIHFALRYQEFIDRGRRAALIEAGAGVGMALLLSAVTAAIGFLSFLPTDYRGVSELGVISGAGMFIALLLNMTLLPALLTIMPSRTERHAAAPALRGTLYRTFVHRYALAIVVAAAIVGAISASIAPYAWFDDDPLNLRDPKSPSVQTLLDLLEDPRVEPYSAELLAPNLAAANALAERFAALPQVKSAETIDSLIPKDQEEKRAIVDEMALVLSPLMSAPKNPPPLTEAERRAAFDKLRAALAQAKGKLASSARGLSALLDGMPRTPETLESLEHALLGGFPAFRERLVALMSPTTEITIDTLPKGLRDRRMAADGRTLVVINPKKDLRDPAARQDFVDAVRSIAPETSGPPVRFTAVGETVVGAFRQAAITSSILIVLLLFAVLRSVRDVGLVLAPLALAIIMTVAFSVLLTTPFNLANIIVLPLILGLGVAFGIQIVMRHRSDGDDALMESSTPRAVVFSALTTIGSFGALAMSSHPGTASMGFLLMLSISLTMLCTLLVLPALLELVSGRRGR